MNLVPIEGKVIVKVEIQEEHIKNTKLYMPEPAREKELGYGLCMSGEYEGKYVYFKKYVGEEIVIDKENLYILDEEDILAYIK